MAVNILDAPNSFITFNEVTYLSQRDCGIVKPFCLPINSGADLQFQVTIESDVPITNYDFYVDGVYIDGVVRSFDDFTNQFDFSASNLTNTMVDGQCFTLELKLFLSDITEFSYYPQQCFQFISDTCFTSKLKYRNDETAFGFLYPANWYNVIRLPIYFRNPQPKNEQKVYLRSDGTRTKLYAKLSKQYEGLVDYTTEEMHQKLVVALSHDYVNFVTDNNYNLECTFEDEYSQEFPNIMQGVNVWPAKFNVMETPFDEQNNNCI